MKKNTFEAVRGFTETVFVLKAQGDGQMLEPSGAEKWRNERNEDCFGADTMDVKECHSIPNEIIES